MGVLAAAVPSIHFLAEKKKPQSCWQRNRDGIETSGRISVKRGGGGEKKMLRQLDCGNWLFILAFILTGGRPVTAGDQPVLLLFCSDLRMDVKMARACMNPHPPFPHPLP